MHLCALVRAHARTQDIGTSGRITILGLNGSGKSTLLRTIAGLQPALTGEVYRSSQIKVAFFSQHVTDSLPQDLTPAQAMRGTMRIFSIVSKYRYFWCRH